MTTFQRSPRSGMPAALVLAILCLLTVAAARPAGAQTADAMRYTVRVTAPSAHTADIEASVPVGRDGSVELMMATWSPGFYRVERYATRVSAFDAVDDTDAALTITQPAPNRWRIEGARSARVRVTYRLACAERSVTTNWVSPDLIVLNGPATFMTPADGVARPHEVRLELPGSLPHVATALDRVEQVDTVTYVAPDFDTLADSPIVAGDLAIEDFAVNGVPHQLVTAGDRPTWNGTQAAADLAKIVATAARLMGTLPYPRYVFLNVCRPGGGGLEHRNSTLLTANAARLSTPEGYHRWLTFAAHEYFHAFNVKRIRPVELGPFDYEHEPRTTSLWFSEGVTSYYEGLLLSHAGLQDPATFLRDLSTEIRTLQQSPGRLVQTLEQSSLGVWDNSLSGVNPDAATVSYYTKGQIAGFLLDARIRAATRGTRSLDDLMRLMFARYSGARGFTSAQLQAAASEVAGSDLAAWFTRTLASTAEVDYSEALAWFGLQFAEVPAVEGQPGAAWSLLRQPDASPEAAARFDAWLAPIR
jgi:predicted metalloprotease with PDZ domain